MNLRSVDQRYLGKAGVDLTHRTNLCPSRTQSLSLHERLLMLMIVSLYNVLIPSFYISVLESNSPKSIQSQSCRPHFQPCSLQPQHSQIKISPSLAGKVYIVTGAASGVGYELAKMLYAAGGTVYIAARSTSRCEGAIERYQVPDKGMEDFGKTGKHGGRSCRLGDCEGSREWVSATGVEVGCLGT